MLYLIGANYNTPICIWLQEQHPLVPPFVYVVPTDKMKIKEGMHVDNNGRVYLPYLADWKHVSFIISKLLLIL